MKKIFKNLKSFFYGISFLTLLTSRPCLSGRVFLFPNIESTCIQQLFSHFILLGYFFFYKKISFLKISFVHKSHLYPSRVFNAGHNAKILELHLTTRYSEWSKKFDKHTGSSSTFEFPSRVNRSVPVCTVSPGATRLTRSDFRLNLLLLKGQRWVSKTVSIKLIY